jgi:hypothetical protein
MNSKNTNQRGETANRKIAIDQSKKCYAEYLDQIVQVKYIDHIQFIRADSFQIEPSVRILVGWLITDCTGYIRIFFDKALKPQLGEKTDCGFLILKCCILDVIVLPFSHKSFKQTPESVNGQFAL